MSAPRIASSKRTRLSNWVTLVENSVITDAGAEPAIYHSFDLADYVSIIAVTAEGRIPLVRQFRPAVRRVSLEFPGGILDATETPEQCAIRELAEEVGYRASDVVPLGMFLPDTGRLGNRTWSFFARNVVPIDSWVPEDSVALVMLSMEELCERARDGSFDNGPHLAMLGLAMLRGLIAPTPMRTI